MIAYFWRVLRITKTQLDLIKNEMDRVDILFASASFSKTKENVEQNTKLSTLAVLLNHHPKKLC